MKKSTKLRILGGIIILINLWAIGTYDITGPLVLLMTFGIAIAFEWLLIKPAKQNEQ